jgi:hypothetical protein
LNRESNYDHVAADSRGLARVGILVISDRASRGEYNDESGKAINNFLNKTVPSNWIAVMKIIPDGIDSVAKALVEMSDQEDCDLVFTTGGKLGQKFGPPPAPRFDDRSVLCEDLVSTARFNFPRG